MFIELSYFFVLLRINKHSSADINVEFGVNPYVLKPDRL